MTPVYVFVVFGIGFFAGNLFTWWFFNKEWNKLIQVCDKTFEIAERSTTELNHYRAKFGTIEEPNAKADS